MSGSCFNESNTGFSTTYPYQALKMLGAQDLDLSIGAQSSFFWYQVVKYQNFVKEPVLQTFTGCCGFGSESQLTLNRAGDMIADTYIVAHFKGIKGVRGPAGYCSPYPVVECPTVGVGAEADPCPCSAAPAWEEEEVIMPDSCTGQYGPPDDCHVWARYIDKMGFAFVESLTINIGTFKIDQMHSDFLNFFYCLLSSPGKDLGSMVFDYKGDGGALCTASARKNFTLHIPIPLFYTRGSGLVLPAHAMTFHNVHYNLRTRRLEELIQVGCKETCVVRTDNCQAICSTDVRVLLETTFVFVDDADRDRYLDQELNYTITQHTTHTCLRRNVTCEWDLTLNNVVNHIMFAIRGCKQKKANNHFNYSNNGEHWVDSLVWLVNGGPLHSARQAEYYSTVNQWKFYNKNPQEGCGPFIYTLPLCMEPANVLQANGGLNFSRVDTFKLKLCQKDCDVYCMDNCDPVEIILTAENYNTFRIDKGVGGLLYGSY